jgi:hypothetical protein
MNDFAKHNEPKRQLSRGAPMQADKKELEGLQLRSLGAIFDYATHATSLGPDNMLISGDVLGVSEQFVDEYTASLDGHIRHRDDEYYRHLQSNRKSATRHRKKWMTSRPGKP